MPRSSSSSPACGGRSARTATCARPTAAGTKSRWRSTTGCFSGWRKGSPGPARTNVAELILTVLERLWSVLEPLGLRMAVMGGLAVSAWKHARATRDVDLLVGVEAADVGALLETLRAAGFVPKRQPPVLRLGDLEIIQLLY